MEEQFGLAKWLAGEMTDEELIAFKQTPEYDTYVKIKEYSSQLQPPEYMRTPSLESVMNSKRTLSKVIPLQQRTWFRIAALVIVFLGLTLFYNSYLSVSKETENATQQSFQLPDHSKVVLNSGSEIEYSKWNWANHRSLHLNGEAYFRVAKGKQFEVNTNLGKVTVLGTQFVVKARTDRFDVTCYEGRVKVNYQQTEIIITKGKRVAFSQGKAIAIADQDIAQPEWLDGQLAFNQETLDHILEELKRQYDVTIERKGKSSTQLFTGSIPMKNFDEAMAILASVYHLQPQKVGNHKWILTPLDANQ